MINFKEISLVTKKVFNNYPTTVPVYPMYGDLYLNVKEFQIYRCVGESGSSQFFKTNYIPNNYVSELQFYRLDDNTFYFKPDYDNFKDVFDAYLIDRYGIKSITKYVGRLRRFLVIIYHFDDDAELAMFQLFFGKQIIYKNN